MNIKRNFTGSKLNLDYDERHVPKGEMVNAENIRVTNSEGSDVGAIENSLGNLQLTNISLGSNVRTVGGISDGFGNKLYWFVKSDTVCAVLEWDETSETLSKVLYDSRSGSNNVLNFHEDYLITGVNILIDSDNNRRFLIWTDDRNPPRKINIDRAKTYGDNGFSDADISVIKAPPINAPTIELLDTPLQRENKIKNKFLQFAYRYRYFDEEYSATSPLSPVAFEPGPFSYDYSTGTNESMANRYNSVKVYFNTGGPLVQGVDLLFKDSNSNVYSIIESFDKDLEQWVDNDTVSYLFLNNKEYKLLSSDELFRNYDNVPILAKSQELINNRIVYGNYLENYDIVDSNGEAIKIDFDVALQSTAITGTSPVKSLKSNRTYELGLVYLDAQGRMTTPLTSLNNTVDIPNINADDQNKIQVTINNLPPAFATNYKFFIKQNLQEYDTLTPTIFYQDGVFVWIKIEGDDVDKISKGDFLFVKSDTTGLLPTVVETEVLDIKDQPENFLEPDTETDIKQNAGTYFKVKASNFSLNQNSASFYSYETKGFKSRNTSNNIGSPQNYIEDPVYYGFDGTDDLSVSGTYSGTEDIRYIVEIDATGTPDTFRWSDDDGATYTSGVAITGAAQALSNGVSITFGSTTGHNTNDSWIVSAKSDDPILAGNSSRNAWVAMKGKSITDETIIGGAQIVIDYKETRDGSTIVSYRTTFISTQNYANIEEWFYGDNIISQLEYPTTLDKVFFRRGTPANDNDPPETMDINPAGDMFMIFQTSVGYSGPERLSIPATLEITEFENNIIFETKPVDDPSEIYFELSQTFDITGGYHQNQTASTGGTVTLEDFNCFAWSNGFESYKIKDKVQGNYFKFNGRQSIPLQNYRANRRIASLIYSGVYEQTSNYNSLNEFNTSIINTKDLDDRYGTIQKLYTRDTDLLVFQEDKIHRVLYNKSVLFNADGSGNVSQNQNVFGQEVPTTGEYGISTNPESFSFYGNRIWFTDAKRGVVLRLAADGLTEISSYGMGDYFRDYFIRSGTNRRLGGYDPYFDQYVLNMKDEAILQQSAFGCGTVIYKYQQTGTLTYTFNLSPLQSEMNLGYNVTSGSIDITVEYDGSSSSTGDIIGTGTFTVPKSNQNVNTATVTVEVTSPLAATYEISNGCTISQLTTLKEIVINDVNDVSASSGVISYSINPPSTDIIDSELSFSATNVTRFLQKVGIEGSAGYPENGDTIRMQIHYADSADNNFNTLVGNRLGYYVSTTDYNQGDLSTLLGLATFPSVTTLTASGATTHSIEFTYTKPTEDHKLYLIWDYTDNNVVANDDSASVFLGQLVDVNVLSNDQYTGSPSLSITTPPVNGTVQILGNLIRYRHTSGTTVPDSFVYQLDNGASQDTATVSITVVPFIGGGGGATGVAFNMSSSSAASSDPELACPFILNTTKYHNGDEVYPTLDDYIYNDEAKTSVFDGQDKWYAVGNSRVIRITSIGRVISTYYCAPGGGGGFE